MTADLKLECMKCPLSIVTISKHDVFKDDHINFNAIATCPKCSTVWKLKELINYSHEL